MPTGAVKLTPVIMKCSAPLLFLLLAASVWTGCRPDDIRFEDNPIPPYDGVPTVIVDAYLTRAYIDLIGREPLPEEREAERNALRAGDLGLEARMALVDRLMGEDGTHDAAYARKLRDDLSGRFLDGASQEGMIEEVEFQRFLAMQDSLAGGFLYPFFHDLADRLERTVTAVDDFRSGTIGWREVNRRYCDNVVYDDLNMNSFNFVNATFDDLFGRYPTEAEFEQAYAAVEFSAPSLLFGELVDDKDSYLARLVDNAEFDENAIRWWGERLLVRPITGAEIAAWKDVAGPEVDIRSIQRLLITSDEYADFE